VRIGAGSTWSLAAALSVLVSAVLLQSPRPEASVIKTVPRTPIPHYADGAPTGFSGGFGEGSCHACHFHAAINAAPGGVTIAGLPTRYRAGDRYPLTITLTRPGMVIGGFQLTARLEDNGAQAGVLALGPGEEGRIAIEASGGIQYASQRQPGTTPAAPDTAKWRLLWTAPKSNAAVLFHVAANAADKDESVDGDYVFTRVVTVGSGQ
jgi:hypothetical protein